MAPTPQKPASTDSKLGILILKLPKMDKSTLHLGSSPSKITKTPSPKKRLSKTASPSRASPKPYLSLLPAGFRNCVGCHNKLPSHLFLAVNLISDSDYKEKCFRCRRVDAVQDCIKTYGEPPSGALPLAAQLDHLEAQRDNGRKWQRKLDHRGFQVSDAYLDEVLEAVKKHDALQEAVRNIGASANAVFNPTFAMNDGGAAAIPRRTIQFNPPQSYGVTSKSPLSADEHRPVSHIHPCHLKGSGTCIKNVGVQSFIKGDRTSQTSTFKKPGLKYLPAKAPPAPSFSSGLDPINGTSAMGGRLATTASALRHAADMLDRAGTLSDGAANWVLDSGWQNMYSLGRGAEWAQDLHSRLEVAVQSDFRFNFEGAGGPKHGGGMIQQEKNAVCTLYAMPRLPLVE